MVRGTTDIINWFENSGMNYWAIYSHKGIGSGNRVIQSKQEEGRSAGDALEDLKAKIKVLSRGTFTMVAYNTAERLPTKGYQFTDIEISQEANTPALQSIAGAPALGEADIQSRIDASVKSALEGYKREQEVVELRSKLAASEKERKELEKSVNDPWNKIIGAIAPHSEKIIAGIFPGSPAAQVAGFPSADPMPEDNAIAEPETSELTTEQQDAVSNFLTTLVEHDTDWLNTIRRLTTAIQKNPGMIGMVKNFI